MIVLFAALAAAAIALPHLLRLDHVAAPVAVACWLAALVVRALAGVLVVLALILFVPQTQLFAALTAWCWHAILPLFELHLGLDGHTAGDAAMLLPLVLLVVSAGSAAWAVVRAARAVRRMLDRRALGDGPLGSVIVGGPDVMVAAAGLTRPRVVVSAGALVEFDDDELAASVEHERGHIARSHRYLLLFAEACRAIGCFLPGGRRAIAQLTFQLERDADDYALARDHDRLALASAICKAAALRPRAGGLTPLADGRSVLGRVRLLADGPPTPRRALQRCSAGAATLTVALALVLAASLPQVASAGAQTLAQLPPIERCQP